MTFFNHLSNLRTSLSARLAVRLLAGLLVALAFSRLAVAACSPWMDKAVLNEYVYGSASTNYLEVYSDWGSFPAAWSGWKIRYYRRGQTPIELPFNYGDASVGACTTSNKTYLRRHLSSNTLGGGSPAVIELLDANGDVVDAFAINTATTGTNENQLNNNSGWRSNTNNATIVGNDTGLFGRCPTLANRLTTDYNSNSVAVGWATTNMINYSGSQSNKAYTRQTDGRVGLWGGSEGTGSGTTFTNCSTNNFNLAKTVNVVGAAPGGTVKFTLTVKNTGNTALSNVTVTDSVSAAAPSGSSTTPPAMTFSSSGVTPSAGSGSATISNNTITWTIPTLASGATASLVIETTIPATAEEGTVYTNTASTSSFTPAQADSASVRVVAPTAHSFLVSADRYAACTTHTATSTPRAPVITITAMSGLNGTGSRVTGFSGSVFLSTSGGSGTWTLVPGTAHGTLSGNVYTFHANDQGQVQLYLANSNAESITASAVSVAGTSPDAAVTSGQTPSTIAYGTVMLSVSNDDTIAPTGYAVVAGRPHRMKATLMSCDGAAAATGALPTRVWYTPSPNHPPSEAAYVSTSSNCSSGLVQLFPAAPAINNMPTLNYTTQTSNTSAATFYLCTADVGQYQVNVASSTSQAASQYQTVRPMAVAVSGIRRTSNGQANPGATLVSGAVLAPAGAPLTMEFNAFRWHAQSASVINTDGSLNSTAAYSLATMSTASGTSLRATGFAATAKVRATLNTPAGGTAGRLASTSLGTTGSLSVPLSAGTRTATDLYYTEVGSFNLVGDTGVAGMAVENYLDASGVHVPLVVFDGSGNKTSTSAAVGRFTPDRFLLTGATMTYRPGASCTAIPPSSTPSTPSFSYMGESFDMGFSLQAQNALGEVTTNYSTSLGFARLDGTSGSKWISFGSNDSLGLWAMAADVGGTSQCRATFSGAAPFNTTFAPAHGTGAACAARPAIAASVPRVALDPSTTPAGTWASGVGSFSARARFNRADSPDGPYDNLQFGILPRDADGVTASNGLDLDADNDGSPERVRLSFAQGNLNFRYGRLRLPNAYGSEVLPLPVPVVLQYYKSGTGSDGLAAGWVRSTDDYCTPLAVPALSYGAAGARSTLQNGDVAARFWVNGAYTTNPATVSGGGGNALLWIGSAAHPARGPGKVGFVEVTPDGLPAHLQFPWNGSTMSPPTARAVFGTYRHRAAFSREAY